MISIVILWIFSGIFTWNVVYNSFKRYFYLKNGEDYWKSKQGEKDMKWFRWLVLIMIIFGPLALLAFVCSLITFKIRPVYYFKIEE